MRSPQEVLKPSDSQVIFNKTFQQVTTPYLSLLDPHHFQDSFSIFNFNINIKGRKGNSVSLNLLLLLSLFAKCQPTILGKKCIQLHSIYRIISFQKIKGFYIA